jgi:ethanolamine utilization protein EutN
MNVCRVKGNVVSTTKSDKLSGMKLMVVVQMDIMTGKETGNIFVAIDTVGAGDGEVVLVVSGSSARQTSHTENKPVDASIIAIVDSIEIDGKVVFRKYSP